MGGSYWLLLLVGGVSLLSIIRCDASCPLDGRPGLNGEPGRDGLQGPKGEKGDPALDMDTGYQVKLKGPSGLRGAQGPMGPKGYSGQLGPRGDPGPSGVPGPEGVQIGNAMTTQQRPQSAFSVIRTNNQYPPLGQTVRFDSSVVNETANFNLESGIFTCKAPGVYYFSFTSIAKVSMCLAIVSDALTDKLTFCDHSRNSEQVLTGGVVLQLNLEQTVRLESYRELQQNSDLNDRREKKIIFNGFLLF